MIKTFQWKRKHALAYAKNLRKRYERGEEIPSDIVDYFDLCLNIKIIKGRKCRI